MNLKEIMYIVERYLQEYPHLRDDDSKLIASVWKNDLKINKDSPMKAIDLLELIANNKVVNPQSITRARRKLQELRPDLRGKKYLERMTKAFEVKTTINN